MREVKFRGKRTDNTPKNGKWVFGDLTHELKIKVDKEVPVIRIDGCDVDENTIGQFIGLHDKNGKEIYEGDIVMWGHANKYSRENLIRKAVVKLFPALHFETFTKTEFGCPHKFHYGNFAYTETDKHLEVIGNIHDNPELLTK